MAVGCALSLMSTSADSDVASDSAKFVNQRESTTHNKERICVQLQTACRSNRHTKLSLQLRDELRSPAGCCIDVDAQRNEDWARIIKLVPFEAKEDNDAHLLLQQNRHLTHQVRLS